MAQLPDGFGIYSGDDITTCDLLAAGAQGCISVTANICPSDMALMCQLALAGDLDGARQVDERLQPLHRDLFLEPNPIPVKYALGTMGIINDFVRLPLTRLSAEHEETVKQAVAQCKSCKKFCRHLRSDQSLGLQSYRLGDASDMDGNYRSAVEVAEIEVPEGLSSDAIEQMFPIPDVTENVAVPITGKTPRPLPLTAGSQLDAVRLQSLAGANWAVINLRRVNFGRRLGAFLVTSGIDVASIDATGGLIDTTWVQLEGSDIDLVFASALTRVFSAIHPSFISCSKRRR